MDIIIDNEERYVVPEGAADALAVLTGLNSHLRSKGRAVVRIVKGGHTVKVDELNQVFGGKPVSEIEGVTVESDAITKLVSEALDELERTTPELAKVCHDLAMVFQGEDSEAGYEPFQKLAEIWKTIKERQLQVAMALDLDLDSMSVRDVPVAQLHEELNDYLAEAAEALKVSDCVLLGDLLEYELAPKAELEPQITALLREKSVQTQNP